MPTLTPRPLSGRQHGPGSRVALVSALLAGTLAATTLGGLDAAAEPAPAPAPMPAAARTSDDCVTVEDGATTAEGSRVVRLAGATRYETAACASSHVYADGAPTAILARGDDAGGWADALAGTVLASALDAPLLLTAPDALPAATLDELDRLGATNVVVLGGHGAVSDDVVAELEAVGLTVERVAGTSRAATAAAVSERAGATGTAFIVNGWRPADALVAGTAAAKNGAALLLADPGEVSATTADALTTMGITAAVIVGGYAVVPEKVEEQLIDALGGPEHVRRISGTTRDETAAAMARTYGDPGVLLHAVAGADANLVDAIPASWVAAKRGGGVVYVGPDATGRGTDRLLADLADDSTQVRVYGGQAAVSSSLLDELLTKVDDVAPTQLRGLWVHLFDQSLKSRENITTVLDAAVKANMNTVIVQGARRHDAYYESDVIPRTVDPTMPADLDMLGVLIPAAHARGLAVHVWYSTMPAYHPTYDGLPLPADHVYVAHGPDSDDPWTTEPVSPAYAYMDPGVPAVQDHIVAMVTEVVRNYDVDGIHLDYLRYSSANTGFHPTSLERFDRLGNGDFDGWRRRQTTDLARRIWLEVATIDPSVAVSMAAIAQGAGPTGSDLDASYRTTKTYADKFQDWAAWVDEGIIDHVFPMAYFREANVEHAGWYDAWVTFASHLGQRTDRVLAIGQGAFLNSVASSASQSSEALSATDGLVTYAYQGDSNAGTRGLLLDHLGATSYASPARYPGTGFKTDPGVGHALVLADDGVVVTATPTTASASSRQATADGTGHAGFVGLTPGTWTFTAPGRAPRTVTVPGNGWAIRVDLGGA